MASSKVFFCLFLHALFLILSSGTRLFNPFSISDQALMEEVKVQNKDSTDKLEIINRHFESKQLSGIGQMALAVEAKENLKSSIERHEMSETTLEFKLFPSSSKRALVEKARDAIKASIQKNGGNPFESKRVSPGGPDPHHH
ncbi:hypothetical protein DITRI_Ditri01bG0137700 [Diplodiscus trichospermus]